MACGIALVGFLLLAILVGPWVLAGLVYRRQRAHERKVEDLERAVAGLRGRLDRALTAAGIAAVDAAAGVEAAEVVPAAGVESGASGAAAAGVTVEGPAPSEAAPIDAPPVLEIEPPEREAAPGAAAGAPPSGTPTPPAAGAPPSAPPRPRIEWERWIGVRGAAVLGGVVLALAGVLFVRYSIERGLISPALRVAIGILAGVAAIGWSERLRRRGYRINADALAGAGIVLLYAAVWAAHALYGFVGAGVSYAVMSLITVACGVLSWRNASLLTAVLGLVGGFATPFLLASGSDDPIGLFGYVLLLDLGLIGLARRRGWSSLTLLALGGTLFYQGLWILTRMQVDAVFLGLAILALFAVVFGFAGWARARGTADEPPPSRGWIAAESSGLLAPFAFAAYFAARAEELGPQLWPIAALLLLLSLAAQWVARRHGEGLVLASGAAAASVAVVLVWAWDVTWAPALVWETVAVCVALAAAFHLYFELDRRAGRPPALSTVVAPVGFLGALVLCALSSLDSPWPWLLGFAVVALMLLRQSVEEERFFTPLLAAAGTALGATGWFLAARHMEGMPAPELYFGVVLLAGALLHVLALRREPGPARHFTDLGAAAYAVVVLLGLLADSNAPTLEASIFLALSVLVTFLAVLAVTRLASGWGYLATIALLAAIHVVWTASSSARSIAIEALVVEVLAVAGLALWPSVAPRLAGSVMAWRAAALAAPLFFWPMGRLWESRFDDRAIALLPLTLAAVTLGAGYRGRRAWAGSSAGERTGHLALFGAVALGFVAIAVPLQLEKEWITVGWALEGLAVTVLWRRLDHVGLKYFAAALFAAVAARLLLNPEVLRYHPRGGLPVLNWLAYAYLVPAACLLGAGRVLGTRAVAISPGPLSEPGGATVDPLPLPLEAARARSWESILYARGWAVFAGAAALGAILVVFVWINLTIVDAFSTSSTLTLSLDRLPARDLTLSLAWVVYAVTLLGLGMARDSSTLRWLSLGFLVLSIGKVFLYDLGELKDLYRVASLVGLAFSLILVSLAYQRFVFRRHHAEGGG